MKIGQIAKILFVAAFVLACGYVLISGPAFNRVVLVGALALAGVADLKIRSMAKVRAVPVRRESHIDNLAAAAQVWCEMQRRD